MDPRMIVWETKRPNLDPLPELKEPNATKQWIILQLVNEMIETKTEDVNDETKKNQKQNQHLPHNPQDKTKTFVSPTTKKV